MSNKQLFNPGWLFDVRSISPLSVVENIDPKTEVIVMVGEKDEVTPTELSLEYYNKLKSNNKRSKIIVIPDLGHEILLHKTILEQIKSVLP
jgi:dipeptidyl aminopeptidase/acylaminoacyl peptidase